MLTALKSPLKHRRHKHVLRPFRLYGNQALDYHRPKCNAFTVFPRFSALGRLPIFEVFGGALNRAGALIKTYEDLDLPFPAHIRTLFIIYDN